MSDYYTQLSTDPFSRMTIIRYTERSSYAVCRWCGQRGNKGKLYIYGTESPMGRKQWESERFCGKQCHDSYHS